MPGRVKGRANKVWFSPGTRTKTFDSMQPSSAIDETSQAGGLKLTNGGKRPKKKQKMFIRSSLLMSPRSPKPLLLTLPKKYEQNAFLVALFAGKDEDALELLPESSRECSVSVSMHSQLQDKAFIWTPLKLAAYKGYTEIVKGLLKEDAVDRENAQGWTALMLAARNGHTDIVVALLLENNQDVNAENNEDWTALMFAACEGHLGTVNALLAEGATVGLDNKAVIYAAFNDHLEVVKALLSRGQCSNINAQDDKGWTALMIAAHEDRADIVQELCMAGANVALKNKEDLTALEIAEHNSNTEVLAVLSRYDSKPQRNREEGSMQEAPPLPRRSGWWSRLCGSDQGRARANRVEPAPENPTTTTQPGEPPKPRTPGT